MESGLDSALEAGRPCPRVGARQGPKGSRRTGYLSCAQVAFVSVLMDLKHLVKKCLYISTGYGP